jgi:hypothetical protein
VVYKTLKETVMKKILFVLLVAASAVACKKEYKSVYTYEDKTNKAKVKFVHTVINAFALPDTAAQSALQVYINDTKITGTSTPLFGYGGNVFPNLEYTMLPAGDLSLKAIIAERPNIPAIPVLNTTIKLEDQQTYTVFLTDSLPTVSTFVIKEDFTQKADSGKYYVRLANMAMNSSPYEFYAVTDAVSLNTGVTNKTVTEFKQVNVGTGLRSFAIRLPGQTTNLASLTLTPVAGRMYTFVAFGVQGKGGARIGKLTYYTSRFQTYSF